jgi:hypothetical protein
MRVYSYSEARQRFAEVLSQARREGQVQIRRRDGQLFLLRPAAPRRSPLDVPAVDSGLTAKQIVALVRESRRSTERLLRPAAPLKGLRPSRARRRTRSRRGSKLQPRG